MRSLARRAPAWAVTAALGLAYTIAAPPAPDLATASYRSWLLETEGFTLWDNAWYGGHHLPAYSLLSPALGALIGPHLLAALSMTAATWLFTRLIDGLFAERATRIAAVWFAFGASVALLSCRVAFDLGIAFALAALVCARGRRHLGALALAVVTAAASPVAGAFLALLAVSWALAGGPRAFGAAIAIGALAPIGLLALIFPEGGTQPFVGSAFWPALAGVLIIAAVTPSARRELRVGAALYAIVLIGAFVVPSAVGGNVDRMGALAAGPIAACALAGEPRSSWRRRVLVVLALPLAYWQANAPVVDFASAVNEPAVSASYYAPLLGELRTLGVGFDARPARIEVVPSVDHWEARWVAPHVMIARGWERQLDRDRNALFYEGAFTAQRYQDWLRTQAVSYVALPDSSLDYSGKAEGRLLADHLPPYLTEVWSSRHWRLYAFADATPLASAPASLTNVGHDSFTLLAPSAGTYLVKLHYTRYWKLASGSGCVSQAPGEWTRIDAHAAGEIHVAIGFSLTRIFASDARCR